MSAVGTLHFPRCDCVRAAVGTTSLTAPRVKMSNNIQRSKYSLSAQSQQDWCHFCKCFVQSHPNAKRNHEQSNGHKRNVELKMKEIRKQKQNEGKEEEAKKRMMASMEAAAAAAYKADLAAGARPEDTHVQKPISGEARLRQEQEELSESLRRLWRESSRRVRRLSIARRASGSSTIDRTTTGTPNLPTIMTPRRRCTLTTRRARGSDSLRQVHPRLRTSARRPFL